MFFLRLNHVYTNSSNVQRHSWGFRINSRNINLFFASHQQANIQNVWVVFFWKKGATILLLGGSNDFFRFTPGEIHQPLQQRYHLCPNEIPRGQKMVLCIWQLCAISWLPWGLDGAVVTEPSICFTPLKTFFLNRTHVFAVGNWRTSSNIFNQPQSWGAHPTFTYSVPGIRCVPPFFYQKQHQCKNSQIQMGAHRCS